MTGIWTVFSTELHRRRLAFVVAAAAGLVPFLLALVFAETATSAAEVRAVTALLGGTGLSGILALLLGGSMLGGEAFDGRLAFWLARPVAVPGLWLGRYLAALTISGGAGLLAVLPSILVAGGPGNLLRDAALGGPWIFVYAFLALAVLVTVGHVLVVGSRDRSGWSALDLLALVSLPLVTGLAWLFLIRRGSLHWTQARLIQEPFGAWTTAVVLAAFTAASVVFLLRGRLDLRRGHRAMAVTLAGVLLPFTVFHQVRALHPPVPELGDLGGVHQLASSLDGRWASISGVRSQGPKTALIDSFLVSAGGGAPVHLTRAAWVAPVFSRDGSTAVWVESALDGPMLNLTDLTTDPPSSRSLGSLGNTWPQDLALSPGGKRAAVVSRGKIEVIDLVQEQSLGIYEGFSSQNLLLFFPDDEHLRLYAGPADGVQRAGGVEIFNLDLRERTLRRTGVVEGTFSAYDVEPDADGRRILAAATRRAQETSGQITIRDGLTGEVEADLGPGWAVSSGWGLFLRDGGNAHLWGKIKDSWHLRIVSPDGERVAEIELPGTYIAGLVGQTPGGGVLMYRHGSLDGELTRLLEEVDPSTGELRLLSSDLQVAPHLLGWNPGIVWRERILDRTAVPEILVLRDQEAVLSLNLETGKETLVAGLSHEDES